MVFKQKTCCPRCNREHVIPIILGFPTNKAMKLAEKGKAFLGGCCVDDNTATHYCKDCGHKWRKVCEDSE